jgi:uncharacterized membrane protein YeiH
LSTATYWITQLAVAVSAAAGVLEAGKKRFDLFGMILIAFAAALGGGSLRDLLLDRTVLGKRGGGIIPLAIRQVVLRIFMPGPLERTMARFRGPS